MRIGRRTRRVELQMHHCDRHEDSGEDEDNYQTIGNPWAFVEPLRGKELAASGLRMTAQPTRFVFPFAQAWKELKASDRIVLDDVCYDLESVIRVRYGNDEFEVVGVIRE